MNRSKQKALEYENSLDYYHYTSDNPSVAYEAGYEQAEEDLALTWEDASVIVTIAMDIIGDGEIHGEQNIYTEVLKRFNEQRKK